MFSLPKSKDFFFQNSDSVWIWTTSCQTLLESTTQISFTSHRKPNIYARNPNWYSHDVKPLSKTFQCQDLSQIQTDSNSGDSNSGEEEYDRSYEDYEDDDRSTVTFCDKPTLVLHQAHKYPHR